VAEEYLQTTIDKFIFRVKTGNLYSEAGVWAAWDAARGVARVGLTDFRQQSSGDVAFVELPPVGQTVSAGDDLASIETVKVDLAAPAPFDGEVTAVNPGLEDEPELINQEPYGKGWLAELKPAVWPVADLLDAPAYLAVMAEQAEAEANK
jgi:glycine cleavage system H protein